MISIFDYSDYRKFIRDYQQIKCDMNSAFSFRYLAKRAGINSSSFYPQIIKGKRNLTRNTIFKTCIALNLINQEAEYFETLVFFNQAETIRQKNFYFEKLVEKQKLRNVKKIQDNQYDYFSDWYHCIIREAVTILDWKGDYNVLAKYLHPQITPREAKESVELLLRLGFIKRINDKFVQSEPLLASESNADFKVHRILNFQIKMLKIAIEAYDRWKPDKRYTSATTFGFSRENYRKYVELLRECRLQLMKLTMNDEHPDQVYMLTMNFFPMTHKKP
jgi:uncharacterized protein (TIGR02147 family)